MQDLPIREQLPGANLYVFTLLWCYREGERKKNGKGKGKRKTKKGGSKLQV